MNHGLIIISLSAFFIGLIHTLIGPDHYVPFIAMARVRRWSLSKTFVITTFCGIGHVLSAAILGMLVVFAGMTLLKIQLIELWRGEIAGWLLIVFGLLYLTWSLRLFYKKKTHTHCHLVGHQLHTHEHHDHDHQHENTVGQKSIRELTPWILFIIFVLGPCEPLIPLMLYPAIQGSTMDVFVVCLLFGLATLIAMLGMVIATLRGMEKIKFNFLSKYGNLIAGGVILGVGVVIKVFGQ